MAYLPLMPQRLAEGMRRYRRRFDQSGVAEVELTQLFDRYFAVFPWESVPSSGAGFDAGCGSGRWAALVAPRVGRLHCVDASTDALGVAQRGLAGSGNVSFHAAPLDAMPLPDGSMDFGYSIGVLHHLPNPEAGLAACVQKLKRGAPMLVYIYYAFDNKPAWFRALWRASDFLRRAVSKTYVSLGPRAKPSGARALKRRDLTHLPIVTV